MDAATELRVSLTVEDFEKALAFYQRVLGLSVENDWSTSRGRCVTLSVGRATVEIIDRRQAELIDEVEVGRRIAGPVRLAFRVPDVQAAVTAAKDHGSEVLHDPVETPWRDMNARLRGHDTVQMTLFQSPA